MNDPLTRISTATRRAVEAGDWPTVRAGARELIKLDKASAEGHFLMGLAEKAFGRADKAVDAFSKALELDARRYDAAVELANQYALSSRHTDAVTLLGRYESRLTNSPMYLAMAAKVYSRLGLHSQAWPLYRRADELQPGVDQFRADLAACAVFVGEIEEARAIYQSLIDKYPHHQRNHYELSRLGKATDASHVEQMIGILEAGKLPPDRNIYLYYAIGKELEDLERWQDAFRYYKLAGDAVTGVANYRVEDDIALIDSVIEVCSADWLAAGSRRRVDRRDRTPVFVVGLPRSGTTLTERIISSHSRVETVDETFLLQAAIRRASGIKGNNNMSPAIITAAARKNPGIIAETYFRLVGYKLGDKPMFVEKLPENFLYLGIIARDFADARMVLLNRNPMDVCFAMYKQSFFRYAYTLENLGRYYVAFDQLRRHWRRVLGDRLIEVDYESLVADQEGQTRVLLDKLGLPFEQACIDFDQNRSPTATASSVQVREKVHSGSVYKWKQFEQQLEPLADYLRGAGIEIG